MTKIKSIIVSAYSCEPNKGSEPGVGWNWVIELARLNYHVNVITRQNNRENIEKGLKNLEKFPNLHFYYYDLPKWATTLKKAPFGVYFYYYLWQKGIVSIAKKLVEEKDIDLIHHITFGVFRQPSYLYKLKKPFVFGPVGGAEMAPNKLLKNLPFKEYMFEWARIATNYIFRISPSLNKMYRNTDIILCKTEDTLKFIPKKYSSAKYVEIEIGTNGAFRNNSKTNNGNIKVLYVGRFIGWKGVHLSLEAVNKANKDSEQIEFTLIGKGQLKAYLQKRVKSQSINFIDWLPQEKLFEYYSSYDCFLFPSLHDSSGGVILEAFSYGLPVICLNIGGPAKLVDDKTGFKIDIINKTADQITDEIAHLLLELNTNKEKLKSYREEAFLKADYLKWNNIVKRAYDLIEDKLN